MKKRVGFVIIAICCVIAICMCVFLFMTLRDMFTQEDIKVLEDVIIENETAPIDVAPAMTSTPMPSPEAEAVSTPVPSVETTESIQPVAENVSTDVQKEKDKALLAYHNTLLKQTVALEKSIELKSKKISYIVEDMNQDSVPELLLRVKKKGKYQITLYSFDGKKVVVIKRFGSLKKYKDYLASLQSVRVSSKWCFYTEKNAKASLGGSVGREVPLILEEMTDWLGYCFHYDYPNRSKWVTHKLDDSNKKRIVEMVKCYWYVSSNKYSEKTISRRLWGKNIAKKYDKFIGEWGVERISVVPKSFKYCNSNKLIVGVKVESRDIDGKNYSYLGKAQITFKKKNGKFIISKIRTKTNVDESKGKDKTTRNTGKSKTAKKSTVTESVGDGKSNVVGDAMKEE